MPGHSNNPSDFIDDLFSQLNPPEVSRNNEEVIRLKEELDSLKKESQRKSLFEEIDRNKRAKEEKHQRMLQEQQIQAQKHLEKLERDRIRLLEEINQKVLRELREKKRKASTM